MAMKRCSSGHFYDDAKYQQCPYCGISNMDASRTMPLVQNQTQQSAVPNNGGAVNRTVSIAETQASMPATSASPVSDEGKTIGIMQSKKGIDPVVGWVVCIEGPSKGQDYRIKSERNFLGRDKSMDIAISGDMGISRENHAVISYNPKNNGFRLFPGEGHGIVYLNDEEVYSPMELTRGDIIELGETKLMFIPICGEDFKW